MINSIYRGGLGNQMFQVAAGIALAKRNNDRYAINPNLTAEIGQGKTIHHYLNSVFRRVDKSEAGCLSVYKEKGAFYSQIECSSDTTLDGYFQSHRYFSECLDLIKDTFWVPLVEFQRKTCVIQVRLGDYVNSGFQVVTSAYFEKAIDRVLSINRDTQFLLCSDSPDQARAYLPNDLRIDTLHGDDVTRMGAIASSDVAIISNSSFAWWGSLLGKRKVTIVPSLWFHGANADIYREDMIKVDL